MAKWGFLTNHALVLIHVFEHPRSTLREISYAVGITERAAQNILNQLEEEDFVQKARVGRGNQYTVNLPAIKTMQTRLPYNVGQIVRAINRLFEQGGGSPE